MSPAKRKRRAAKGTTTAGTSTDATSDGFTDAGRAAMKERAHELRAAAHAGKAKEDGEAAVLARIAEMLEPDRAMANRLRAEAADRRRRGTDRRAREEGGELTIEVADSRGTPTRQSWGLFPALCST